MPRVGLKRAEMVTAALNAAEQRPRDNDRCDVCLYSRWYHRIAEALGETDHRFTEAGRGLDLASGQSPASGVKGKEND